MCQGNQSRRLVTNLVLGGFGQEFGEVGRPGQGDEESQDVVFSVPLVGVMLAMTLMEGGSFT